MITLQGVILVAEGSNLTLTSKPQLEGATTGVDVPGGRGLFWTC